METEIKPYRWFIAYMADKTYRFIPPTLFVEAEQYIGAHGGSLYTHAGKLIFSASKSWYQWSPKTINVPEIDCFFSEKALQWLVDNEDLLIEKGGKYYDNIPRCPLEN